LRRHRNALRCFNIELSAFSRRPPDWTKALIFSTI
jgi:hypothetical protein